MLVKNPTEVFIALAAAGVGKGTWLAAITEHVQWLSTQSNFMHLQGAHLLEWRAEILNQREAFRKSLASTIASFVADQPSDVPGEIAVPICRPCGESEPQLFLLRMRLAIQRQELVRTSYVELALVQARGKAI